MYSLLIENQYFGSVNYYKILFSFSHVEIEQYEYYQKTTDGLSYIRVANFTGANKKTITLSENWNSDTKYTYELAFGNLSDMTAITFSASVSEWTNSSTTNL